MKVATFVIIALFALSSLALAVSPSNVMPVKEDQITEPGTPDGREGGETIFDAWVIYALPFNDTGYTSDNINDYDEICPYSGSLSPDVVYAFEPAVDMCISIDLCDSFYDTKVFVYEDAVGNLVACNDDAGCGITGYQSQLPQVELFAGHVYYIVVDGYGSDSGDYVLEVAEVDCPQPFECIGVPEGEPTCYDNYVDNYNGGCNSAPNVFSIFPVSPDPYTVCGEGGVFTMGGLTYRDTDWYQIFPCGGMPITMTVNSEFPALIGFLDISNCAAPPWIGAYALIPALTPTSLTEYLPYGPAAIFVAAYPFDPLVTCGMEYSLTVEGYTEHCDPTPVEDTTWGTIKSLYR